MKGEISTLEEAMEDRPALHEEAHTEEPFMRGTVYRDAQARRPEAEKDALPYVAAALELACILSRNQGRGTLARKVTSLIAYLRTTPPHGINAIQMEEIVRR